MKILPRVFFNRPADIVAKELLGCLLCIKRKGKIEKYKIFETEAYMGPHDLASHSSKGRTNRTETMFKGPSTIYIYLVYGMYEMLNIVTGRRNYPAAVLIRGVGEYDGPGKLTKALRINRKMNGKILGRGTGIWIEKLEEKRKSKITSTPRIGVNYAGKWKDKKLRFLLSSGN